jgi:hypothetical protein
MNVNTIIISPDEARQKLDQYKAIATKKRTAEDNRLQSLYAAVSKGARVLNLAEAFKQTGLNEALKPKLAIARADWGRVFCQKWSMPGPNYGIVFSDRNNWREYARDIKIPLDLPSSKLFSGLINSAVPHIPPEFRPKFKLHNYHILFEVEEWETYPVDPFLLRRISGMLFVVEAEWELTALEASLLSSMSQGN